MKSTAGIEHIQQERLNTTQRQFALLDFQAGLHLTQIWLMLLQAAIASLPLELLPLLGAERGGTPNVNPKP